MRKLALIVDDELATCALIEEILTSVGIEFLSVTNSAEAVDIFQQLRFAVAFFDYQMVHPDGLELTRQMRYSDYNPTTPIVLISDDQEPGATAKGFAAGASFFLYKPIDDERVQRVVRAIRGGIEHCLRRTRRVPLQSRVRVSFCGEQIEGVTLNVSMEGLLVRAPRTLPVGSSVRVSVRVAKAMPLPTAPVPWYASVDADGRMSNRLTYGR